MAVYGTLTMIQEVTVGSGGQLAIEFTNIPQTYTDLYIVASLRSTLGSGAAAITMQFNGSTTGYTAQRVYSIPGLQYWGDTGLNTPGTSQADTAGSFSQHIYRIANYTGSNNKTWSVEAATETNASGAYLTFQNGLWANTSAVTSVKIFDANILNLAQHSRATLYGINKTAATAKATGGSIYQDGEYWYHVFTSSGTFTPSQNLTCDYLVVAGGGGGAGWYGGGGGAGGLRSTLRVTGGGGSLESPLSLTSGTGYTVTVGGGGPSQTVGWDSTFHTVTSNGGGRGGSYQSNLPGGPGGSGGGGGAGNGSGVWLPGGSPVANQGFAGGTGHPSNAGAPGGGGAGGAAANAGATNGYGTDGGIGVFIPEFSRATQTGTHGGYYAGGGGGGSTVGGNRGTYAGFGGRGGGGNGSVVQNSADALSGTTNTGGGGGGNGYNVANGAAGGSGVVIIRYAR